ncbi:membrane protein insertase YidC [[Mycoplasma] mobile]|uniref:Putative preprotein translocase subunit n=1 Tax=Mycoplasma mobile (strain ATCC 43663 / 163K / NCTC 11711) TaxID=267748 RepID=Q6KH15_MYCM1|nr:membrane protein insertase YidC [[Mycoplasma] mobile]AAT28116.1 putative preprotein translocase subunit [Mycoplasma mobile 163K]
MAKKRSNKYDFFQGVTTNPVLEKKQRNKNIWKWIKRVFFVFLGAITLTGLIQTFIFPTSTAVGSGTEFAANRNGIVPNVASFEKTTLTINGQQKEVGFFYNVNNQIVLNEVSVASIRNQINSQSNSNIYGTFDTRTSAVRIITGANTNNRDTGIFANGNNLLVKNTAQGSSATNNYVSIFSSDFDIPFFITDSTNADNTLSGVASFGPFIEEIQIQNIDGTTTTGFRLNNLQKTNLTRAKILSDTVGTNNNLTFQQRSNLNFSLDILQALYIQTLGLNAYQSENFQNTAAGFTEVSANTSFIQWINTITSGAILNEIQRNLLISYNLAISSYLNISNFRQSARVASLDTIVFDKNLPQAISTTFDSQNNTSTPLVSNTNQFTITDWGQAWAQGPWFGLFVYPISAISVAIINGFPNPAEVAANGGNSELASFGIIAAIFFVVFLVRIFSFLVTSKSVFAQVKMQELNPKKAKIDAKYAAFKGNKEMERRKAQEVQQLYKKNNVKLSSQFTSILVSMPIFFAMFKIIQGIPSIKVTTFLGVTYSATSWQELLFNANFAYLPILIVVFVVQLISQFVPRFLTKRRTKERTNVLEREALRKANRTQNIVSFVFAFFGLVLTAGVQIYWIAGGIFTILQSVFVHYFQNTKLYQNKLKKYI